MKDLDGKVALVTFGEAGKGLENTLRATALALAARGVRIVVTGNVEKILGETVGEIAYQGGKARHVVGNAVGDVGPAIERAIEVFGGLHIVIVASDASEASLAKTPASLKNVRRLIIAAASATEPGDSDANVIVKEAIAEPEDVAAVAVFLCSAAARAVNGQTITVGRAS